MQPNQSSPSSLEETPSLPTVPTGPTGPTSLANSTVEDSSSPVPPLSLHDSILSTEEKERSDSTILTTTTITTEASTVTTEHRSSYSEIPTVHPRLPLRSPLPDDENELVRVPLLCTVPVDRLERSRKIYEESFSECVCFTNNIIF